MVRGASGAVGVWRELRELGLVSPEKERLGRWGTSLQFLAIGPWVSQKEINSLQKCILKGQETAVTVRGILGGCKRQFLKVRVVLEQRQRESTVSFLGDLK